MVNEYRTDETIIQDVILEIRNKTPKARKTGIRIIEELMEDADIELDDGTKLNKYKLFWIKDEKLIELLQDAQKALKEMNQQ